MRKEPQWFVDEMKSVMSVFMSEYNDEDVTDEEFEAFLECHLSERAKEYRNEEAEYAARKFAQGILV